VKGKAEALARWIINLRFEQIFNRIRENTVVLMVQNRNDTWRSDSRSVWKLNANTSSPSLANCPNVTMQIVAITGGDL